MENKNQIAEVDGIALDAGNKEFVQAVEYALYTNKNIYLTGKAGTGKTTFLKYLKKVSQKKMVVLAPTGVAAINASGETIHSFFQIPPSVYLPDDARLKTDKELENAEGQSIYKYLKYKKAKVEMIRNIDTIIIDEVSMVRSDLMDVIDKILRVYRESSLPFGGVQMIFIGDVFQLPPVVKDDEKEIIMKNYDGFFFFHSKIIETLIKEKQLVSIELNNVYRQKDKKYIDLLNRVRENKMLESDFVLLNSKMINSSRLTKQDANHIILTTTNVKVRYINNKRLAMLPSESKVYKAVVTGNFDEKERPTDKLLELKVGAQVIFVRNDKEKRYHNGKIGVVTYLDEDMILVEIENQNGNKMSVGVYKETWKNISYNWNQTNNVIEEKVVGTFMQFPLKLAWAITVHKSQGMTFDKVVADIGNSFEMGQVYVALSRCTSLDGLMLSSRITHKSVITDQRMLSLYNEVLSNTASAEHLSEEEINSYQEQLKNKEENEKKSSEIQKNLYVEGEEEDIYGKDTVSSLRKKLAYKENEYQNEIARLNVKNRELKDLVKKLQNLDATGPVKLVTKTVTIKNEELDSEIVSLKLELKDLKQENKRKIHQIEMLKRLTDRQNKQIKDNRDDKKINHNAISKQVQYINALENFIIEQNGCLPKLETPKTEYEEKNITELIEEIDNLRLEIYALQEQLYNANEIIYIIKNHYNIPDDFLSPLDGKEEVLEFISLYSLSKKPSIAENDNFKERFKLNKEIDSLKKQLAESKKDCYEQKQLVSRVQTTLKNQIEEDNKIIKDLRILNKIKSGDVRSEIDRQFRSSIEKEFRSKYDKMLKAKETEIGSLRYEIRTKDFEIKRLGEEKEKTENTIASLKMMIKESEESYTSYENSKEDYIELMDNLYKSKLDSKDSEINLLNERIQSMQEQAEKKDKEINEIKKSMQEQAEKKDEEINEIKKSMQKQAEKKDEEINEIKKSMQKQAEKKDKEINEIKKSMQKQAEKKDKEIKPSVVEQEKTSRGVMSFFKKLFGRNRSK